MSPITKTGSFKLLGLSATYHVGASADGWDWTTNKGDKHTDIVAAVILKRAGFPRILRFTVGPLTLMFTVYRPS